MSQRLSDLGKVNDDSVIRRIIKLSTKVRVFYFMDYITSRQIIGIIKEKPIKIEQPLSQNHCSYERRPSFAQQFTNRTSHNSRSFFWTPRLVSIAWTLDNIQARYVTPICLSFSSEPDIWLTAWLYVNTYFSFHHSIWGLLTDRFRD
jgi:hypothetical protein